MTTVAISDEPDAAGIGVVRLRDAPPEWSREYAMLALSV
jgi:hypothetical protein